MDIFEGIDLLDGLHSCVLLVSSLTVRLPNNAMGISAHDDDTNQILEFIFHSFQTT